MPTEPTDHERMANLTRDQKIVFMVAEDMDPTEPPTLVLGVPTQAWEYMKDGHTHTFDLRNAGLPMKLVIFGCPTHQAGIDEINAIAADRGVEVLDHRNKDFGLK